MIIVYINPAGVEEVQFKADSDVAEDLDFAVWPLVRREVNRLDAQLKAAASEAIRAADSDKSENRKELAHAQQ